MKIISKFDYSKVLYSKKNNLNLLLQAIAPKVELKEDRKSINIITAIDTSGSMAGDKIDYAKKSILKLIDHLGPNDTLGLIEFTTNVRVMSDSVKMTADNKAKLKADVLSLHATDSTNFSGALVTALEMSQKVDGDCRIIMFTDGLPNVGITNHDQLMGMLDSKVKKGISITSFGYGSDHDSDLLRKVSKFGGNYAYIKNPDDALTAFAIELGGLLSCYAQDLKFTVKPKDGVMIKEVISDLDVTEDADGAVCVSIADIFSEETKNVIIAVEVPEQTKFFPRDTSLVDVVLSYTDAEGTKQRAEAKAKVKFVKTEQEVSTEVDPDVANPLAIALLAQAQSQATVFAKSGNFAQAQSVLRGVQGVVSASNCMDTMDMLRETETYFASSASYSANKISASALNSTLTSGRGMGSKAFRNHTHTAMMDSFSGAAPSAPIPAGQNGANQGVQGIAGQGLAGQIGGGFGQGGSQGAQGISGITTTTTLAVDNNSITVVPTVTTQVITETKKTLNKKRSRKEW